MIVPVKHPATFAGVSQNNAAWNLENANLLLGRGEEVEDNVDLYGVDGKLGRPSRRDQLKVQLEYSFDGNFAPDGSPRANAAKGLELNQDAWVATVYDATRDAEGCIAAVVTKLSGAEVGGGIQLSNFEFTDGLYSSTLFVDCIVPFGMLVAS